MQVHSHIYCIAQNFRGANFSRFLRIDLQPQTFSPQTFLYIMRIRRDVTFTAYPKKKVSLKKIILQILEITVRYTVRIYTSCANQLTDLFVYFLSAFCGQNYTATMGFVSAFEALCPTKNSVKRLRTHPSFTAFLTKWSLPVYFQIRCVSVEHLLRWRGTNSVRVFVCCREN